MSHASLHRDAGGVLREWAAPTNDQEALRKSFIKLLEEYDDATARSVTTWLPTKTEASPTDE